MSDLQPEHSTVSRELAQREQVALTIVAMMEDTEKAGLAVWLQTMLTIKESDTSTIGKVKAAMRTTLSAKVIWPMVKSIAVQIKKHGWDQRSAKTRWATASAGAALAVFGGQSAGIAALGSAIGVPLWIVFGGGGALAKTILDEVHRSRSDKDADHRRTTHFQSTAEVVDAVYVDLTDRPDANAK